MIERRFPHDRAARNYSAQTTRQNRMEKGKSFSFYAWCLGSVFEGSFRRLNELVLSKEGCDDDALGS